MSKLTRSSRAAAAPAGTAAADPHIKIMHTPLAAPTYERTPEPIDLFTQEELAAMPLVIVNSSSNARASVERHADGKWFRLGGTVYIREKDGVRQFQLILFPGANEADLNGLLKEVESLRTDPRPERWLKVSASWADDRTFTLLATLRPYADPYTFKDTSLPVVACTEPLCCKQWHHADADDPAWHTHETITKKLPSRRGGYEIKVRRLEPEEKWTTDVFADEFYGTTEDVTAFVNDLQWAQQSCDRANNKAVAA